MTAARLPRTALAAAVALVAFVAGAASSDAAPKTIVGEWVEAKGDCGTPFAWAVGAKSLSNDMLMCDFSEVKRVGSQVQFQGTCNDGSREYRETVLANDAKVGLVIHFVKAGGNVGPLKFCGRR